MSARARAASVFQCVADAVDSGLAAPLHVHVYSPETGGFHSSRFEVRVGDNEVDQLAEWVEWLGVGAVAAGTLHRAKAGAQWRAHTSTGVWQGWQVNVWARVDEPAGDLPTEEQYDRAALAVPETVWISTPRARIEYHALAAPDADLTACRRSTRTGHTLTLSAVVDRHQAVPCTRCYPGGAA